MRVKLTRHLFYSDIGVTLSFLCGVITMNQNINSRYFVKLSEWVFQLLLLTILFTLPISVLAGELDYQDRGDRSEGTLPEPIGSYDIELLSAMAFRETFRSLSDIPDSLTLRFNLPGSQKPYVEVKEIDQKSFYRMDKLKLQKPDLFKWDTGVLKQIVKEKGLQVSKLGVVARLKGQNEPLVAEEVAPALLYSGQLPKSISSYTFVFKTNADAELKYFILRDQSEETLATQSLGYKVGRKPFEVRWNAADESEGYYKVVVKGFFKKDSSPISQSVRFYHKPTP